LPRSWHASRISAATALLDRGWGRPYAVGGPDALALLDDIARTRPTVAGQLPQVIEHQPDPGSTPEAPDQDEPRR